MKFFTLVAKTDYASRIVIKVHQTEDAALTHRDLIRVDPRLIGPHKFSLETFEIPSDLYVTDGPENCDGFGTRTVGYRADGFRYVDIQDKNRDWQLARYDNWDRMIPEIYAELEPIRYD